VYELTGTARDWFVYYSSAIQFHRNRNGHFFVTADRDLLSELQSGVRHQYWQRRRLVSVAGALRLVGRVMLACDLIYDDAGPNYSHQTSPYTVYCYLSPELAPSRIRLHRWVETHTSERRSLLEALEQSMHDRVVDLLKPVTTSPLRTPGIRTTRRWTESSTTSVPRSAARPRYSIRSPPLLSSL
jgi:hypothetical protein